MRPVDQWFSHSGDAGDIWFALPAIRAAGGGRLYIYDHPGRTMHGMTEAKFDTIAPLLCLQPYLDDVIWCPEGWEDCPLNDFRRRFDWMETMTLADVMLKMYGYGPEHRDEKWLVVDEPKRVAKVVIHRSARYHNPLFPWWRVFEKYGRDAVVVGHPEEAFLLTHSFGGEHVPYYPTRDFLELARVIAGAELFIGNQSSPAAVAEGLKVPIVSECYKRADNCKFERPGRINVYDQPVQLPDLT